MRAITRDEQDERLTDAHHASEDAARDLPQKPSKSRKLKLWRVRISLQMPADFTAEMVKAHVSGHLAASNAVITRVRQVLE